MNKSITIILTTYNRNESLLRAFKSLANQTYKNFNIIIIDDGSLENAEEFLRKQAYTSVQRGQLNKTRFISLGHTGNIGLLRNIGVGLASGDYVCFCSDDGEYSPLYLELMSSALEDSTDIVLCNVVNKSENKEVFQKYAEFDNYTLPIIRRGLTEPICSSSFLIKTILLKKYPWSLDESDPKLTNSLFKILYLNPIRTAFVQENLYTHYVEDNRASKINQENLEINMCMTA